MEILDSELILSDMELLDRFKKKKGNPTALNNLITKCLTALDQGIPTRRVLINEEEWQHFKSIGLLTGKPVLYTCNVGEAEAAKGNELSQRVEKCVHSSEPDVAVVPVCAKIEAEITQLEEEARPEFLSMYGLKESQLNRIIRETRRTLRQETYYTVGEQEARAYSYPHGCTAREAAGYIHSDFEKGFVKAEITPAATYLSTNGRANSRIEAADYRMQDGDIIVVRFK